MDGPIRVLHVVVNMNRGGAETLIMNLYRNIDRSKIQFDFLTCKEGVFDQEILELGGKLHTIPYITDRGHFHYIKNLNQFFNANKHYQIVHSHMDKMSGFVLEAAKKAGIQVRIAHSHNTQSEGGFAAKLYKEYAGINIGKSATHYLACSNSAAKWLFKNKANSSKLLKNGIDTEKFTFSKKIRDKIRNELGVEDRLVLGNVGRFNHQKNHSFLIDVFSELNIIEPKACLVLVGDGALRSDIEEKVKRLGLEEKVKFLGVRSDINSLLQAFDLFVFPSFHEGLPVTLIEAQGAGLPCLISENITKEVDMGINLVKFLPINRKNVWVEEIVEVLSKKESRNIPHEALSQKGYDIKNTANFIHDFYMENAR
ncbi:glycosyltransferase involved in cell wall biosynthesis [Metabacillus crassostreae]|uniref:glycosyltransferase family 1 protein n=1 Tax=Metabacillus crassostreae TaxID=929098 RepID=UPI001958A6AD|nr:glycosyltransferase family 1 protein [Metabacillus crassostreae]MBM7604656.1 glycosyltransferase involved in cell wall biosynthesis [Metabacillus crassostreae]